MRPAYGPTEFHEDQDPHPEDGAEYPKALYPSDEHKHEELVIVQGKEEEEEVLKRFKDAKKKSSV